jgi:mannose-6-phosphate isomerase-like protein (cupin superfamily)
MIEKVVVDGVLYAIIVRRDFGEPGIHFFTPGDFSQQLGYMSHPQGHRIAPHVHREVDRNVRRTQEVLVIRKGRLRVDFYDDTRHRVGSRTLAAGDVMLLVQGGHGFQVVEACEMIEIKQGPYLGDEDKVRFEPADGAEGAAS